MRVLLSEASGLTAREHLSVLGPAGIDVDAASGAVRDYAVPPAAVDLVRA